MERVRENKAGLKGVLTTFLARAKKWEKKIQATEVHEKLTAKETSKDSGCFLSCLETLEANSGAQFKI